jgi:hypothetical protein
MTNFHTLNEPLCNELIELMQGYLPITHVLLNGDVGALYYIIRESGVRNTYLNQLMDGLEKRKNNGTAYPLSITHSNMDALYKAVSMYLNKCFELTGSTLQSIGEVT